GVLRLARPLHVLRRDLGRDVRRRAAVGAQRLAEQRLALAGAVDPGGVEEGAAERERAIERAQRLGIVGPGPPAHAPHAVADFRDLPAGAAEAAIAHEGFYVDSAPFRCPQCASVIIAPWSPTKSSATTCRRWSCPWSPATKSAPKPAR